jgi:hypothetical protein
VQLAHLWERSWKQRTYNWLNQYRQQDTGDCRRVNEVSRKSGELQSGRINREITTADAFSDLQRDHRCQGNELPSNSSSLPMHIDCELSKF